MNNLLPASFFEPGGYSLRNQAKDTKFGNKNKNKEKLPMEGISFSLLSFIFIS